MSVTNKKLLQENFAVIIPQIERLKQNKKPTYYNRSYSADHRDLPIDL